MRGGVIDMMLGWVFALMGLAFVGFGVGPAAEGRVAWSDAAVVVFSVVAVVFFTLAAAFFRRCRALSDDPESGE